MVTMQDKDMVGNILTTHASSPSNTGTIVSFASELRVRRENRAERRAAARGKKVSVPSWQKR